MNLNLPLDYAERVYAGVLGKVIGVYLGRPCEGWTYDRIQAELGDVEYYVHDKLNVPLVVTDDDISGTFTFLRALNDVEANPAITAKNIGDSWLNYIIPNRSILWWGGLGNSTEHTAFLRLKQGIEAPRSGSMQLNGKVVAEQIGAQIFIDGWAMVSPGNPDQAARLAREAAMVSHDGEAVHGAVVLAVMEALAFVESDTNKLIDAALGYIPADSVIRQLIDDVRSWHSQESDWRLTRKKLEEKYGYHIYGGNCHMVPNHGLIIHALLHGNDDFSETLKIINTCGWDTDCNSGNIGCLMGIKHGLAGIDAGMNRGLDWRGPVADRLYVPTAEGGRGISDCAREAVEIIGLGQRLQGIEAWQPKGGAQFHFDLPGSVQGFHTTSGTGDIQNVPGHSRTGTWALMLSGEPGTHFGTPVFSPSKDTAKYFEQRGYALMASPRVHSGQALVANLNGDEHANNKTEAQLYLRYYGMDDQVTTIYGQATEINQGTELLLRVPLEANPVFEVGIRAINPGAIYLDYLTWRDAPNVTFKQPDHKGTMWRRAWINAVDAMAGWTESFRLIQNEGIGIIAQGTRDWQDYIVTADVTPHLAKRAGIIARVQGLRRYYALCLVTGNKLQLIELCNQEVVLAETDFSWAFGDTISLKLTVSGPELTGYANGETLLKANSTTLKDGAIGLLIEEGRTATQAISIQPLPNQVGARSSQYGND